MFFGYKMTLRCFAKAFQPGKLTLTLLRQCSSASHSLKSESGGSSVVKENSFQPSSLDIPPVLFIAKFNRLIEISEFSRSLPHQQLQQLDATKEEGSLSGGSDDRDDRFVESNWSPQSLTQNKIKFILDQVRRNKTFDSLSEKLQECPGPLFESPPKAIGIDYVRDHLFADEEKIKAKSDGVVLQPPKSSASEDGDLLHWASTKLDLRRLPTYYMMLSKFRLTLLVNLLLKISLQALYVVTFALRF